MDMPSELTALNITPQGALLRWNPPMSNVDNYVLTLTHDQGKLSGRILFELADESHRSYLVVSTSASQFRFRILAAAFLCDQDAVNTSQHVLATTLSKLKVSKDKFNGAFLNITTAIKVC